MESLLAKSRWKDTTSPFFKAFSYSTVAWFFFKSLAPIITKQPISTSLRAVYFPIPVLPPVISATFLDKSWFIEHRPPAKYLLVRYSKVIPPSTPKAQTLSLEMLYVMINFIMWECISNLCWQKGQPCHKFKSRNT